MGGWVGAYERRRCALPWCVHMVCQLIPYRIVSLLLLFARLSSAAAAYCGSIFLISSSLR